MLLEEGYDTWLVMLDLESAVLRPWGDFADIVIRRASSLPGVRGVEMEELREDYLLSCRECRGDLVADWLSVRLGGSIGGDDLSSFAAGFDGDVLAMYMERHWEIPTKLVSVLDFTSRYGIWSVLTSDVSHDGVCVLTMRWPVNCALGSVPHGGPSLERGAGHVKWVARSFGVKQREILYVSGRLEDARLARRMGMRFLGIGNRVHGESDFRKANPEALFSRSLLDVMSTINGELTC